MNCCEYIGVVNDTAFWDKCSILPYSRLVHIKCIYATTARVCVCVCVWGGGGGYSLQVFRYIIQYTLKSIYHLILCLNRDSIQYTFKS